MTKRRTAQKGTTKAQGSYSRKMETGQFLYGGYTNHLNSEYYLGGAGQPRRDHRKGAPQR